MSFVLYVIFSLFFGLKSAFNVDTKNTIIYENPSQATSLFGYSLVLYPPNGNEKAGLFVGAPAGSLSSNPKYKNGVLFKCPIFELCEEITQIQQETSNLNTNVTKFWNGGSIDINSNFDRFVSCASRTIEVGAKDYYLLRGACYWFHVNGTNQNYHKIRPLSDNSKNFYQTSEKILHYYSYAQAGFSVHMKQDEMVITAPGMLNSIGSVILYKESNNKNEKNNFNSLPSINNEFRNEIIITNPTKYRNKLNTHSLFGYSIGSGKFYETSKRFYVAGSPKSSNYQGQIHIFEFNVNSDEKINFIESKKGEQFGEYFGSSLTVGDLNSDGFDDLIVGAPFYTNSLFNEGRVQVFLGGKTQLEPAPIASTIFGIATNGQFGTTVQFLGDLNRDGFGDVAIAAPYELENSGVVYIFEGSEYGLNPQFTQRIVGREVFSEIRGFGISISRAVDIDNNTYLDLAIGAHLSGHVAVLRTNPIVQVFHSLSKVETQIEKNASNFQIITCFWFSSQVESRISIRRNIQIDEELDRAQLESSISSQLITLKPNKKNCTFLKINLKKSVENSIPDVPIKISLSHKFESTPTSQNNKITLIKPNEKPEKDNFCASCVVYDGKHSTQPILMEIPFSLNCGKDNICNSYLEIQQKTSNLKEGFFILGSSDVVNLEISVINSGEDDAHHSFFLLSKPEIISFREIPQICEEKNKTLLQCNFKTSIKNGFNESVNLQLEFLGINTKELGDSLVFSTEIFTSSQNTNPKRTEHLELKIKREADIKITGNSEQDVYSFGKIVQRKPNFTQIFQVEKRGISPIDLIEIEINIPQSIKHQNNIIQFIEITQFEQDLTGRKLSCQKTDNIIQFGNKTTKSNKEKTFLINCHSENVNCSRIICLTGPFSLKNRIATIELKLEADFNFINQGSFSNIIFTTNAKIRVVSPRNFEQTGEEPDFAEISSNFVEDAFEIRKIDIWIFILAIIFDMFLLLLLIIILKKIGFFKRNVKKDLEKLKLEENNLSEDAISIYSN